MRHSSKCTTTCSNAFSHTLQKTPVVILIQYLFLSMGFRLLLQIAKTKTHSCPTASFNRPRVLDRHRERSRLFRSVCGALPVFAIISIQCHSIPLRGRAERSNLGHQRRPRTTAFFSSSSFLRLLLLLETRIAPNHTGIRSLGPKTINQNSFAVLKDVAREVSGCPGVCVCSVHIVRSSHTHTRSTASSAHRQTSAAVCFTCTNVHFCVCTLVHWNSMLSFSSLLLTHWRVGTAERIAVQTRALKTMWWLWFCSNPFRPLRRHKRCLIYLLIIDGLFDKLWRLWSGHGGWRMLYLTLPGCSVQQTIGLASVSLAMVVSLVFKQVSWFQAG